MAKPGKAIRDASKLRKSLIAGQADRKEDPEELILFSFKFFDDRQGQTFAEWENDGLLCLALNTLKGYSSQTMGAALSAPGKKFECYGGMPPKHKTEFKHPTHVPADAKWARIHVQGKECIIGHIVKNIFYVVFLDRHHRFWITTLKNT